VLCLFEFHYDSLDPQEVGGDGGARDPKQEKQVLEVGIEKKYEQTRNTSDFGERESQEELLKERAGESGEFSGYRLPFGETFDDGKRNNYTNHAQEENAEQEFSTPLMLSGSVEAGLQQSDRKHRIEDLCSNEGDGYESQASKKQRRCGR